MRRSNCAKQGPTISFKNCIIFFVNSYHHEKLYASTEADKGLKSSYRPNEGIFGNPLILNVDLI